MALQYFISRGRLPREARDEGSLTFPCLELSRDGTVEIGLVNPRATEAMRPEHGRPWAKRSFVSSDEKRQINEVGQVNRARIQRHGKRDA